jgi:hypothetical protein
LREKTFIFVVLSEAHKAGDKSEFLPRAVNQRFELKKELQIKENCKSQRFTISTQQTRVALAQLHQRESRAASLAGQTNLSNLENGNIFQSPRDD